MTREAIIKVLRYKAEHIKTKIKPEFFAEVADMLDQEPKTWSLDDAREDFMHDVYNTLDFLPTNNEANRIIDSFDRVTKCIEQEPCENCCNGDQIKKAKLCQKSYLAGMEHKQDPCEDLEYEKDLNELKEQILKEGNTLLTKQDLLERFCEIDKEYNGSSWNLLQILSNINILIGEEPCEDAVSRQSVLDLVNSDWKYEGLETNVASLPPVAPKQKAECSCDQIKWERDMAIAQLNELGYGLGEKPKVGHWFYDKSIDNWRCSECNETPKTMGYCGSANFMAKHFKFCNHCGVRMVELQESENGNEL